MCALSFLTGKMRRWSHDHLSLEQCTASSALLLVTTPSHNSSKVLKKCVFILNNKLMEIAHLRQDCASCSQNLGRNESPEFLPSPFDQSSSSTCPTPQWPGANSPQLQSLLLILDSFSFVPFLSSHSPPPCPNLTHPQLHLTANTLILPSGIFSLWILCGLGLQFPALFLDLHFQSFLPLSSHLSLLDTASNVLDQEMLSIRPLRQPSPPEPP